MFKRLHWPFTNETFFQIFLLAVKFWWRWKSQIKLSTLSIFIWFFDWQDICFSFEVGRCTFTLCVFSSFISTSINDFYLSIDFCKNVVLIWGHWFMWLLTQQTQLQDINVIKINEKQSENVHAGHQRRNN